VHEGTPGFHNQSSFTFLKPPSRSYMVLSIFHSVLRTIIGLVRDAWRAGM